MMGLVATHVFTSFFSGDKSLNKRLMLRAITPLQNSARNLSPSRGKGLLPLAVIGAKNPMPINYELPVASGTVKSAILLAALNTLQNHSHRKNAHPRPYRTDDEIFRFDISAEGVQINISGQGEVTAKKIIVPGDPSSAAFLIVAALIIPGSKILVKNVCINPARTGLYTTLKEMGRTWNSPIFVKKPEENRRYLGKI